MTKEKLQELAYELADYWESYAFWSNKREGERIAERNAERAHGFERALETLGIDLKYECKTGTIRLKADGLEVTATYIGGRNER